MLFLLSQSGSTFWNSLLLSSLSMLPFAINSSCYFFFCNVLAPDLFSPFLLLLCRSGVKCCWEKWRNLTGHPVCPGATAVRHWRPGVSWIHVCIWSSGLFPCLLTVLSFPCPPQTSCSNILNISKLHYGSSLNSLSQDFSTFFYFYFLSGHMWKS